VGVNTGAYGRRSSGGHGTKHWHIWLKDIGKGLSAKWRSCRVNDCGSELHLVLVLTGLGGLGPSVVHYVGAVLAQGEVVDLA